MKESRNLDEVLQEKTQNGFISCPDLLEAASLAGIPAPEARRRTDEKKIKIKECRLGFFGWDESSKVTPQEIPAEVTACVRSASHEGIVTCPALWKCAETLGVTYLAAGAAADACSLKVRGCKLGIF
ncbi:MAG: hypothetical protein JW760_05330 [Spirochaetales bacterium]|nr:hypothetical protein [Spirochaetales bacterium]